MTNMRLELDRGNTTFALEWLRTGRSFCTVTEVKKNNKTYLKCDYIEEPLPYHSFCKVCMKCQKEMKEILLRESGLVQMFHVAPLKKSEVVMFELKEVK